MTSDSDLEAKTRFSPRSILDDSFLGEGVTLWRGVPAQAALKGGGGVEGGNGEGCTLYFLTCLSREKG
jgi:hypothetical protein